MRALRASLALIAVLMLIYSVKGDDGCYRACGNVYFPLCGQDGNEVKFFGNECLMESHNACKNRSELMECKHHFVINFTTFFFDSLVLILCSRQISFKLKRKNAKSSQIQTTLTEMKWGWGFLWLQMFIEFYFNLFE